MAAEGQRVSSIPRSYIPSLTRLRPDIPILQGFAGTRGRPLPLPVATWNHRRFLTRWNEADRPLRQPVDFADRQH
jgi:hypothetical protein